MDFFGNGLVAAPQTALFRFQESPQSVTLGKTQNMLTDDQNTVVLLMFLSGVLFLGLNFIAYSIIFPGPPKSKRIGYALMAAAVTAFFSQQEYRALISLGFKPEGALNISLGLSAPVFLLSLVYYRFRKNQIPPKPRSSAKTDKGAP